MRSISFLALAACVSSSATASTYSKYSEGHLVADGDSHLEYVHLDADSRFTLETRSYAGGPAFDGRLIQGGGFIPVLSLFSKAGELLGLAQGGSQPCSPRATPDATSGFCWDTSLSTQLVGGDYFFVLTQDGNLPAGALYDDGYTQAGISGYTGDLYAGNSSLNFVSPDGAMRSNNWFVQYTLTPVPESGSGAMALLGLGLLLAVLKGGTWKRRESRPSRKDTRKHPLLAGALAASTCLAWMMPAQALQIRVDADAYVSEMQAGNNYGAVGVLSVGPRTRSYLKFGIDLLPAGLKAADVEKATLVLWVNKIGASGLPGDLVAFDVARVQEPWLEASVVFQGAAGIGFPSLVANVPVSLTNQFVRVDVTSEVRAWIINPASNHGLALVPSQGSASTVFFDSKENSGTGHEASLELVLIKPGPTGPAGPRGLPGAAGPKGDRGDKGEKGDKGDAGAKGAIGPVGAKGDTGPVGPQGFMGLAGPIGIQGPVGPKGDQGDMGLDGRRGPTGDTGPQGPAGPSGSGGVTLRAVFPGPYSGTWRVPSGVRRLKVTVLAGGGSGGIGESIDGTFADSSPYSYPSAGGGGGGGCFMQYIVDDVMPEKDVTLSVSAGGRSDVTGEMPDTTLDILVDTHELEVVDGIHVNKSRKLSVTARGGEDGVSAKRSPLLGGRGKGGSCDQLEASTYIQGALLVPGQDGGRADDQESYDPDYALVGGQGAHSYFGFGGQGGTEIRSAINGHGFGSGGGGGGLSCQQAHCMPLPRGRGGPGLIIIEY